MAEYRPKGQGLERVLGTGALFSTAYGNVGSSIYYALGLVAIYAAGATPIVFVIAGLIFAATAATYAEATTMYPEAGGSASFSRRAFNEFWSFFAGWGQMLTYIVTISISAFFVPHYLGVFWEPLGESPADIIGGVLIVVTLGVLNVVGVQESAGVNIFFAVADFLTQVLLVVVGVVLVLDPDLLLKQIDFGSAPTISDFLIAIPVGMVAYTGIETISNMAEEARDYEKTIPRGIGAGGGRGGRDLRLPAGHRPLGDAGQGRGDRAGQAPGGGRVRRRPDPGRGGEHRPGRPPGPGGDLRGRAGGHDPVHRHQRRADRGLAAHLLHGPAPPVARGAAQAPPAVPHAVRGHRPVRDDRVHRHPARAGRLPGDDLRLRGDALVHHGPRRGRVAAA